MPKAKNKVKPSTKIEFFAREKSSAPTNLLQYQPALPNALKQILPSLLVLMSFVKTANAYFSYFRVNDTVYAFSGQSDRGIYDEFQNDIMSTLFNSNCTPNISTVSVLPYQEFNTIWNQRVCNYVFNLGRVINQTSLPVIENCIIDNILNPAAKDMNKFCDEAAEAVYTFLLLMALLGAAFIGVWVCVCFVCRNDNRRNYEVIPEPAASSVPAAFRLAHRNPIQNLEENVEAIEEPKIELKIM